MVVGDDHVHPQGAGQLRLLHGGDAAVHGDDQGHPLPGQQGHGLPVQAIALIQAAGDVGGDGHPPPDKEIGEQAGGGDAVHVVVPVDRYLFAPLHSQAHPLDGLVHVPDEKGVAELAGGREQQLSGLLRRVHPPG